MKTASRKKLSMNAICFFLSCLISTALAQSTTAVHQQRAGTMVITDVMVVDGIGIPAEGPKDIIIEGKRIKQVRRANPDGDYRKTADALIDGKDKYALPGFINMHGHLMDSRAGETMPFQYQYNLWLGAGMTTIRDVGSDAEKALVQQRLSREEKIAAPRMFLYMWCGGGDTEEEIRQNVRELKAKGADGLKCHQMDLFTFRIVSDEAKKLGLKIAHHVGIKDANAWHDAEFGTSTIEHWYGVPDAALDGIQQFPADFNHANELHRFRYAGRLWREANPEKLEKVLQSLVDAGVAWDPTFCIYEASRDLQRAVTQPWFKDYLHPALEKFFTPNPKYHGSFFWGWTNTDEVYWKENYQIWMRSVKSFAEKGGVVTTGEDAGFIYQMFGFGYLRELELHEEAGFHPLEVIKHATYNGAKTMGMDHELGRIKATYLADIVVVNGNPLANLHILFPKGINPAMDKQRGNAGGIEWTIKGGIPYHAPTLFEATKSIVTSARQHSE